MEGDAGTRQLNPTDAEDAPNDSVAVSEQEPTGQEHQDSPASEQTIPDAEPSEGVEELAAVADGVDRRPARLGRGWVVGICAALGGADDRGGGRRHPVDPRQPRHRRGQPQRCRRAAGRQGLCHRAAGSRHRGDVRSADEDHGVLHRRLRGAGRTFGGILVEAYQAANVQVAVSDMRAAVERHDPNGSVDVLVAVRVKVTNSDVADQESGYRLRVTMTPDRGQVPDRQDGTGHVVTAVLDASTDAKAAVPSVAAAGVVACPRGCPLPRCAARGRRARGAGAAGGERAAARLALVGLHRVGRRDRSADTRRIDGCCPPSPDGASAARCAA